MLIRCADWCLESDVVPDLGLQAASKAEYLASHSAHPGGGYAGGAATSTLFWTISHGTHQLSTTLHVPWDRFCFAAWCPGLYRVLIGARNPML